MTKNTLGKAISYCFNQRDKLVNFMLNSRFEFDNNRAACWIKPFVIDRKNWLFANTARGVKTSNILYSMVELVKENNLSPYAYLKYLLETLPNINISDDAELDKLLP